MTHRELLYRCIKKLIIPLVWMWVFLDDENIFDRLELYANKSLTKNILYLLLMDVTLDLNTCRLHFHMLTLLFLNRNGSRSFFSLCPISMSLVILIVFPQFNGDCQRSV